MKFVNYVSSRSASDTQNEPLAIKLLGKVIVDGCVKVHQVEKLFTFLLVCRGVCTV